MKLFYLFFILFSVTSYVTNIPVPDIEISSALDIAGYTGYLCPPDEVEIIKSLRTSLPTCKCLREQIIEGTISFGPSTFEDEFKKKPSKGISPMGSFEPLRASGSVTIQDLQCVEEDGTEVTLTTNRVYLLDVRTKSFEARNTSQTIFNDKKGPTSVEYQNDLTKSTEIKIWGDVTIVDPSAKTSTESVQFNFCNPDEPDSYTRLIWSIVNNFIMSGQGCSISQGSKVDVPNTTIVEVPVNELLKCGQYTASMTIYFGATELIGTLFVKFEILSPLDCA